MELFNNDGVKKLRVPGFGRPIDFSGTMLKFHHGTNDYQAERITVREVAMLRFMDTTTDKSNWNTKVFDQDVVAKWCDEAVAQPNGMISQEAFDWCLTELRDSAKTYEQNGFVKTLESGSRCIKSDTIIPDGLRNELRRAVQQLMEVDDESQDWHPNSNDQVLNLVHPSLYPLVYGRTRVLPTGQVGLTNCLESSGQGHVIKGDQAEWLRGPYHYEPIYWSTRFQWLPAEVKFSGDTGTDVRVSSYINNLRPYLHRDLYSVIEKLTAKAIPLWNRVLTLASDRDARVPLRIKVYSAECVPEEKPAWASDIDTYANPEQLEKIREYLAQPDSDGYLGLDYEKELPPDYEEELPNNWEDRLGKDWPAHRVINWKVIRMRKVIHPNPDVSAYKKWQEDCDKTGISLEEDFRQQGLQVIVKLSSIELTPEKQDYPGGNWHLEGMLNEHIVATAIYYYDVENVTSSRLSFRQEATLNERDLHYPQYDHKPLATIFGTDSMRDEPAIQGIGSIATPNNRFLVFPNTRQHRVQSFSLADPTRSGHRRFLVLWLVDPHYKICSTANVPPQQSEWMKDHAMDTGFGKRLPPEIMRIVMEHATDGLMSLEEAKEARLELMKERTQYQGTVEDYTERYNLCEH